MSKVRFHDIIKKHGADILDSDGMKIEKTHPGIALNNAEKVFHLGKIEKNMIKRHMFPLTPVPPKYRESVILCVADKICATKETVGGFKTKLMKKMAKNKYRRNGNDA